MRTLFYTLLPVLFFCSCQRGTSKIPPVKADSILNTLHRATRYIDSARNILVEKDSAGDNEHIAAIVLAHTPLGDSIRSAIRGLITLCHAGWPNQATLINLDNAFHHTSDVVSPDRWNNQNFTDTPTASAYAILITLEDECTFAARMTMSYIDSRTH
jgi:hypothetical protein